MPWRMMRAEARVWQSIMRGVLTVNVNLRDYQNSVASANTQRNRLKAGRLEAFQNK